MRVPSKRKCQVWRGTDSESNPEAKAEKKTDTKAEANEAQAKGESTEE